MAVEICSWEKGVVRSGRSRYIKKDLKEEKASKWPEKTLRDRFLKDTEKVNTERTWQNLKEGHLKK